MSEKRYSIRREILEWCQRHFKYSDYSDKQYDWKKKIRERKEVNCSDR